MYDSNNFFYSITPAYKVLGYEAWENIWRARLVIKVWWNGNKTVNNKNKTLEEE